MKIYSAANPPEAHIVCELLKSHQIDCEVRGEGMFGLQGELPFGEDSEPYVWLYNQSKRYEALSLIKEFTFPTQSGKEWICQQCGETIEPQFALCWQCGTHS